MFAGVSAEGAAGFIVCGCVTAETHPADAKAISAIVPLNRIKPTPELRCERYQDLMTATVGEIKRHHGAAQPKPDGLLPVQKLPQAREHPSSGNIKHSMTPQPYFLQVIEKVVHRGGYKL
jgi:hypothetical protein